MAEEKEKKEKETKKKKVKKDNKKEKENKKSKKPLIIVIVVLSILVLSLLGVVGFLVYRHSLENKTTGSTWSDKYYEFLKEQSKAKKVNESLGKESDISFVQTKSMKDPMMVVEYDTKYDNKDFEGISVFGIVDDKVIYLGGQSYEKEEVKLYYDIDKKEYKYYIHGQSKDAESFTSLDNIKYDYDNYNVLKLMEEKGITDFNSDEYKKLAQETAEKQLNDTTREQYNYYKDDKKVTQNTLDGKTIEYNKADEKFVDVDVEPETFDYKQGMDIIKLRDEVVDGKTDYKEIDDLLNKAIKKIVKEQIDLVEKVKQDIEKAKADIKADEERKAKEAEAALYAKGLTVGSHNLKFGNYTTSVPDGGIDRVPLYGTITLKPNGVFHIKTNFEQSSGELRNIDEDGTYTVGTAINSFDEQDAIKFTTKSGYRFTFFVTDNYMNSQWLIYKYSGN